MSMQIWQKIRQIRELETSGRTAFANEVGSTKRTIEGMEREERNPRTEVVESVCKRWPEYALWLMTDQVQPEAGHINPDIKRQSLNLDSAQKAG